MAPRGPRLYTKTLVSLSRINLLHALQRAPMTVDELAASTGLHRNSAREHLHRLIEVGLVRSEPILRGRRGRPVLRYRATAAKPTLARAAHQLDALGEHMVQCGFEATIDSGARRMTVGACPFARMSEHNPQVCQVHRALIANALGGVEGPIRAGELRRGAGGKGCTLELIRAAMDGAQHNI